MNVKTIMLGCSGVGKTRFLNYLREARYQSCCPTLGVDFIVYKDSSGVKLQIWDTSGSERFKTVVDNFLKGIDLCIFVYKDKVSFEDMMNIIAEVKNKEYGKRFCILSLGEVALGKVVASKYGFFFFHVNIERKDECLLVLKKLSHLCYEEQKKTNFLNLSDKNKFNVERKRDRQYCWWSFC